MGWFSKPKTPQAVECPICHTTMIGEADRSTHLETHITVIRAGLGAASGQYTWNCACGPSGMKWPGESAAQMALEYHLIRAHQLPVDDEVLVDVFDRISDYRHMRGDLGGFHPA